jgi:hypothetical protein
LHLAFASAFGHEQLWTVLEMDGVKVKPFSAPDKTVGFKNLHDVLQPLILQNTLWVSTGFSGVAPRPAPIVAQPVRELKINGDTKAMTARPFGSVYGSPVKRSYRAGDEIAKLGTSGDGVADSEERLICAGDLSEWK